MSEHEQNEPEQSTPDEQMDDLEVTDEGAEDVKGGRAGADIYKRER